MDLITHFGANIDFGIWGCSESWLEFNFCSWKHLVHHMGFWKHQPVSVDSSV